ncbi:hypothetical protein EDD15DRAFT_2203143 [Pisolithus albus]|nr:hypothetical protein EDD15DRAFT_2203143 [Pisolithus albus]
MSSGDVIDDWDGMKLEDKGGIDLSVDDSIHEWIHIQLLSYGSPGKDSYWCHWQAEIFGHTMLQELEGQMECCLQMEQSSCAHTNCDVRSTACTTTGAETPSIPSTSLTVEHQGYGVGIGLEEARGLVDGGRGGVTFWSTVECDGSNDLSGKCTGVRKEMQGCGVKLILGSEGIRRRWGVGFFIGGSIILEGRCKVCMKTGGSEGLANGGAAWVLVDIGILKLTKHQWNHIQLPSHGSSVKAMAAMT